MVEAAWHAKQRSNNKTVFRHLFQIFGTNVLWVHAKFKVKTRDGSLDYKRIFYHLFVKNALDNHNAACNTATARNKYHGEKQSFNWEKYTNLHVEKHNIKATLTAHGYYDWTGQKKVIFFLQWIKTKDINHGTAWQFP